MRDKIIRMVIDEHQHATMWQAGGRVFHTFTIDGYVLPPESFPIPSNMTSFESLARSMWYGRMTRVA